MTAPIKLFTRKKGGGGGGGGRTDFFGLGGLAMKNRNTIILFDREEINDFIISIKWRLGYR